MKNFVGFQFVCILLLVAGIHKAVGQESTSAFTMQYWGDYNLEKNTSKRLDYKGTFGFRTISPHEWNQYWFRPSVNYKVNKFIFKKIDRNDYFTGGINFYYTDNFNTSDVLEISPYQSYTITVPNRLRFTLEHRLELNERFEMQTDDWSGTFGLNLSYKGTLTFIFQGEVLKYTKGFYIPVSYELYYNIKETIQFNDQIRVTPGLGYHFSKNWSSVFLVGYNLTKTNTSTAYSDSSVIFRMRVYHRI
jgi:hypothetical protein